MAGVLLERETQLNALASLLDDLGGSGGKVVLVRGEAGIGKSALVAEFIARHGNDVHILFGGCDDLLTPQTLGAFWDVARDEPSIGEPVRTDDRRRLQTALLDLLSRSLRPTVLVIEDSQWADEATLDVIKFLGRRIGTTNGLMVLTYRDTELDADHPLRHVIGDLPATNVVRMSLGPLSAEAVTELIGDAGLDTRAVVDQTDGNPLYVTELVALGADDVPASIQDMVLARAGRLSADARRLLETVSVLPGEADRTVVAAVAGDGLDGLDDCERAGLLRADDATITFIHELQRRSVEASLRPDVRRNLNAQMLRALARQADASVLVHHAREAGDVEAIIQYAPIAARAAMTAGSGREAVAHFRLLDPHIDDMDPDAAAGILRDWARHAFYLHDPSDLELVERAIRASRRVGDPVALGRILAFAARVDMQQLLTEPALEHVQEAVSILEDEHDDAALAYALSMLAYVKWLYDEDVPAMLEIAERALAVADASGDPFVKIRALTTTGNIEYSVGIAGGMERLEMARSLAETHGDRDAEVRALSNMTSMTADYRDMALATDFARRAIETAARYEMQFIGAETRAMYAELLLWQGRWSEVEDVATEALGTQRSAETIAWRVLGTLQARRGRSEARTALERMWSLANAAEQLTVVDPAAGALAEYMWLTGDLDPHWLARLDEILAEGIEVGNPWPSGAFALWMWELERLDARPEGTLDMYGWIIDGDLDPAVAFWRDRGIPYELAIALMHGTTDQQLEALRIAEDLGADALAAKIRGSLIEAGHTPHRGKARTTREHVAGLTARQAEVLDLLAKEMSNAEIADELFLSPRTVENHVAAVLMKLDAPNRAAAIAAAHDQGIL